MRRMDSPEDASMLADWLRRSVAAGDAGLGDIKPRSDVTAAMYFYWSMEVAKDRWPEFEGALLATWRNCGMLKTIVVSNMRHDCLVEFARRYGNVELQTEETLVPGDTVSMSYDCNSRLWERFDTDYLLIVQNDGFPLRPGLDEFVERGYDFIGAPHCRPLAVPNLLTRLLRYCPSNGGFSLRTRKVCKLAAELWQKGGFAAHPYVEDVVAEDYFFTKTLPRAGLGYWLRRSQAPSVLSDRFSYGATFPLSARSLPFGFHTATAFGALCRKFSHSIIKGSGCRG